MPSIYLGPALVAIASLTAALLLSLWLGSRGRSAASAVTLAVLLPLAAPLLVHDTTSAVRALAASGYAPLFSPASLLGATIGLAVLGWIFHGAARHALRLQTRDARPLRGRDILSAAIRCERETGTDASLLLIRTVLLESGYAGEEIDAALDEACSLQVVEIRDGRLIPVATGVL